MPLLSEPDAEQPVSSSEATRPTRRLVSPAAEAYLNALARRAIAERIPLHGSIAMTHRCHLRCIHCYLGDERYTVSDGGELPTGFWLSLLDELAGEGCLTLLITGGEPLLRTDFGIVYERAIRLGMLVTVFTNGTLVENRVAALFSELPPRLVEISLYGSSAEVYERVTGVPGSFARCLRGVDALSSRGVVVGLKAMILRDNQHEIPSMRRMARERGLDFRLDPTVTPCLSGDGGPLAHRISPCDAAAIEMQDESLAEKTAEYYDRRRHLPGEERLFSCLAGVTGFHVNPRGALLPCLIVSSHSYDLRSGSFRDGWRGAMARFRDQGIEPGYECHQCERRFVCGICPALSQLETGSPHRRSEYNCRLGEARLSAIKPRLDKDPDTEHS